MLHIRALIFNIVFWLDTFILSLAILLLRPLGIRASYSIGRLWSRLNLLFLRLICGISCDVRVTGNLPDEPAVYLAKHQSAWETIAFPSFLPPFMWVLKRDLFFIPVFGWGLMALGHIGIDRKSGARAIKKINKDGKKILDSRFSMVIFPEGTRVAPGEMREFNPGGVSLAISNGVPVVPVTHNAGMLWERRAFVKKPGKITVIIDEPIPTKNLKPSDRRKLTQEVYEVIERRLKEIGG